MLKKFRCTYLLVAFFMALALLAGCGGDGGGGSVYTTTWANITCDETDDDMITCKGIPYAEPPEGDLRFARPQPKNYEDMEIVATEFGNACVQDDGTGSEDCLFLNVFYPQGTQPGDNLPVMVWIHGGALIQGSGSNPGYDLPALVNEGVVVVTINYRLNAFGFLPHPAFEVAAGEDPTGNFGLKDQVLALQWVRAFIRDLGGNRNNVTIFGESAGGHSVLSLLVSSERNSGLFHKAIVQSGSYSPTQTALYTTGYYGLGLPFADLLGYDFGAGAGPCSVAGGCATCDSNAGIRACLRDLTVEEVIATQDTGPAWAWISPVHATSTFLPKSISAALTDGDVANVPVMIGSNLNEGSLFTALFMDGYNNFASLIDLENGVTTLLATDPRVYDRNKVASDYTGWATTTYGDTLNKYRNAHSMIFTDATFTCNNLNQWGQLANAGNDVYAYWFTDADAPINPTYAALGALSAFFNLGNWGFGANHSFEIQYIFGHVQDHADVTADQIDLSNRMITYWTNFAKNGVPGGGWLDYTAAGSPAPGFWNGYVWELNPGGDLMKIGLTDFAGAHYCGCWADPQACWPAADPS